MFKWNFPYFKVCPLLLVLPLGITEKHLISLPLLPSSGIYSLSYLRCLNPFTVLQWTHSSISMLPFYWGVQNWSQHSQSVPPVLNRGEGLSPHQLTALSPAAPGGIGCKGALLACVNVLTSCMMYPSTTLPVFDVQPICT